MILWIDIVQKNYNVKLNFGFYCFFGSFCRLFFDFFIIPNLHSAFLQFFTNFYWQLLSFLFFWVAAGFSFFSSAPKVDDGFSISLFKKGGDPSAF